MLSQLVNTDIFAKKLARTIIKMVHGLPRYMLSNYLFLFLWQLILTNSISFGTHLPIEDSGVYVFNHC